MLAAALAGAESVADIARFGRAKLSFLRRFRPFANGTPSHDQLGIILARLDPVAFQRCFVAWTAALTNASAEVIAIDGKTVRRSYQKKGGEEPIHVVSAFAARQRMVLGQMRVGDKSNEIVAIPALLGLLAIEGAVVTIDAMGCQRDIAQTIIDKKADYILALKGNQGTLRDDVEVFANEQKAVAFKNTSVSRATTVDGDHGRIETRTVTVFHDIGWLQDTHQWPGLKSVVMVESERETDGKVESETRFYITSLTLAANTLGPMIRSHWMIENGLHWVLDMIFRDDDCRVRTDNAPFNLAIIKHIALNVLENPQKQGFATHAPQSRRVGRKRPRRVHRRMKPSVDSLRKDRSCAHSFRFGYQPGRATQGRWRSIATVSNGRSAGLRSSPAERPQSTYRGRSRPRPWTPQLGGKPGTRPRYVNARRRAGLPCQLTPDSKHRHDANLSSRALASFKSSVSKPSVNQP